MKKNNLIFLVIAVVAAVFLLSSCATYNVSETISPSGVSHTIVSINMSSMRDMFKSLSSMGNSSNDSMAQFNQNITNHCNDFINNKSIKLSSKSCNFDNSSFILTIAGDSQLNSSAFNSSKNATGTIYSYNLKNIISKIIVFFGGSKNAPMPTNSSVDEQEISMSKKTMPMIFTVRMPGKITSSDFGKISDNVISGDYYGLLLNNKTLYARSFVKEEAVQSPVSNENKNAQGQSHISNGMMIVIGLIIAIVVVFFLILVFVRKSKK